MEKPKDIFRILHLSDIHAGLVDFQLGYCLDKRFFGRLNQVTMRHRRLALDRLDAFAQLQRELQADFTVCTGDLTSIGSEAEFRHCQRLLKEILEYAGENFAFVPGNHDAYVKKSRKALENYFYLLNNNRFNLEELPASFVAGPVEFILLNAARPCAVWLSTGEMTPNAWEKLDYILSHPAPNAKVRVLLGHFPVCDQLGQRLSWRTKLVGHGRLAAWAERRRFDAMLSGHVHLPFVHHIGTSPALAVGAGSITIHRSCAQIDIHVLTGEISAKILKL